MFVVAFLSVWPFGSIDPPWEARLGYAIALLAFLWAAFGIVTLRFRIRLDIPTLVLGGLLLLSVCQLIPLPVSIVRVISPTAARLHEQLLPESSERLPGETSAARPDAVPLSLNPESTRQFAVRLAGVIVAYAAVRNWLANRNSLNRMAWGGMVVGAMLSIFAIGQFFSAPVGMVYWVIPSPGNAFGPFINRNHYVDYIALCMGWTIGLLLVSKNRVEGKPTDYATGPFDFLTKPVTLAATISLGLMSLSLFFSLSRGGLAAAFLAALALWFGLLSSSKRRVNRIALLIFFGAVGGGLLFFGIAPLEARIHSFRANDEPDDRVPLWKGALSQVPGFMVAGSGNGTFSRVEPLGRPQQNQPYVEYTNAHNEYVEAVLEGGIPRIALTLLLVFAAVVQLGRAYRKRSERAVGPYLLGIWFGLFVIAAHAFTDFGIHVPSVAVFAAITLAFGMAAAQDPEFGIQRKRHRKKTTTDEELPPVPAQPSVAEKGSREIRLKSPFAMFAAVLIAGTGLVVALDLRNVARFNEYWLAGKRLGRPHDPELIERRIAYFKDAVAIRPQDSTGHLDLGKARLQGACDLSMLPLEAVIGSAFPRMSECLPSPEGKARLQAGLADLRAARSLSPLYPEIHLLLGQHAGAFETADPPIAYFDRAKILNATDPNIWYACGLAHSKSGNAAGAADNWKRSLELSPQQLSNILAAARVRFTPADIVARVLPDNPISLIQAAEHFRDDPPNRTAILERTAALPELPDWKWQHRMAVAQATDLLGRTADAEVLWNRAVAAHPKHFDVRDGYSAFLEREERYEEALTQLNFLVGIRPGDGHLRDRMLFVKHGIELNEKLKP